MIHRLLSTLVPALALTACAPSAATARTACAVIDLADQACDAVVVRLPGGREVTVPRASIEGAALARASGSCAPPPSLPSASAPSSSSAPVAPPKAP